MDRTDGCPTISPNSNTNQVTLAQVTDLTQRLHRSDPNAAVPTFVFDAGYDPAALTHELSDVAAGIVVRIRDDRVFYPDPTTPRAGTRGRPRRHGPKIKLTDPDTWPTPDLESSTTEERYGTVKVSAWHGLHPKLGRRGHWAEHDEPPIVRGTVIRVDVEHLPKPTSRTKKTLWLWAAGPGFDLDTAWRAYLRRFDIDLSVSEIGNQDPVSILRILAGSIIGLTRRFDHDQAEPFGGLDRRPAATCATETEEARTLAEV